jgi:hypothetical protein
LHRWGFEAEPEASRIRWIAPSFPYPDFRPALSADAGLPVGITARVCRFSRVCDQDILRLPHTLDFSAWYAGTTAVPLILLALLALYGFRASLGGRRLIELPD